MTDTSPTLLPVGDNAILVRFGTQLSEVANLRAIALSQRLNSAPLSGVLEIVPNLVSVLVRYDSPKIGFDEIAGELRLVMSMDAGEQVYVPAQQWRIPIVYGGEDGPDLQSLATELDLSPERFVALHTAETLRVLATGFAPGFVYCGFHKDLPSVARRAQVRRQVPAGSVLFAAGQTAIAATAIPTGWHVIGRTDFRNFDVNSNPPTKLRAGDSVAFQEVDV